MVLELRQVFAWMPWRRSHVKQSQAVQSRFKCLQSKFQVRLVITQLLNILIHFMSNERAQSHSSFICYSYRWQNGKVVLWLRLIWRTNSRCSQKRHWSGSLARCVVCSCTKFSVPGFNSIDTARVTKYINWLVPFFQSLDIVYIVLLVESSIDHLFSVNSRSKIQQLSWKLTMIGYICIWCDHTHDRLAHVKGPI